MQGVRQRRMLPGERSRRQSLLPRPVHLEPQVLPCPAFPDRNAEKTAAAAAEHAAVVATAAAAVVAVVAAAADFLCPPPHHRLHALWHQGTLTSPPPLGSISTRHQAIDSPQATPCAACWRRQQGSSGTWLLTSPQYGGCVWVTQFQWCHAMSEVRPLTSRQPGGLAWVTQRR